jgi:hypothetical protein|nr:MAG TPA: hypothetical protein [Caudoviricetes sp.]DAK55757.1 MAG TPA: hypothetical protein [Caudoviricetes sp.]DAR28265.1 MAG TPA: hypothetical protein [Caudoviricetes sp.]
MSFLLRISRMSATMVIRVTTTLRMSTVFVLISQPIQFIYMDLIPSYGYGKRKGKIIPSIAELINTNHYVFGYDQ